MSKIKTNRESIPGITLSFDRATFIEWLLTGFDKENQIFSLMGESLQKFRDQMGAAGLLREKIDQDSEIWKMLGERARKLAGESPEKKRQLCEQVTDQVEDSLSDWTALSVARARVKVFSNGLDPLTQIRAMTGWLSVLFVAVMKDSDPLDLIFLATMEQATDWIMSHAVEPGTAKDDVKAGRRAVRYFREMLRIPSVRPGRRRKLDSDWLIREYEMRHHEWKEIRKRQRELLKQGCMSVYDQLEKQFGKRIRLIDIRSTPAVTAIYTESDPLDKRTTRLLKKLMLDWLPSEMAHLEIAIKSGVMKDTDSPTVAANRISGQLKRARRARKRPR